jgi:hypothetical protein
MDNIKRYKTLPSYGERGIIKVIPASKPDTIFEKSCKININNNLRNSSRYKVKYDDFSHLPVIRNTVIPRKVSHPPFLDAKWTNLVDKNSIDTNHNSQFWMEDPLALLKKQNLLPTSEMTDEDRLNTITRVIIIISAILFTFKFEGWWMFLALGIFVVMIIWFIIKGCQAQHAQLQKCQVELVKNIHSKQKRPIIKPLIKPEFKLISR